MGVQPLWDEFLHLIDGAAHVVAAVPVALVIGCVALARVRRRPAGQPPRREA